MEERELRLTAQRCGLCNTCGEVVFQLAVFEGESHLPLLRATLCPACDQDGELTE